MKNKNVIIIGTVVLLLISIIVALCSNTSNIQIGFAENNYKNILNASFKYFDGSKEKKIEFNEGKTAHIEYSLEEEKGSLELQIKDNQGNIIESKKGTNKGEIKFEVDKTQNYSICILANKVKGKYKVKWSEE